VTTAMFTTPSVLALTSDHRDNNMREMCQKDPGACVGINDSQGGGGNGNGNDGSDQSP
jgi:hypothetical protein